MEIFDPVLYSIAENRFFLKHIGESPVAVMQSPLPKGVQPEAVQDVLGTIYELDELEKHRGTAWVGHQPIQDTIETYLREWERWAEDAKRGAPRFPTLHAWDGKGRPHRGGVGSDSSRVTTYMDENGKRQPFRVDLKYTIPQDFKPSWVQEEEPLPDALVEDAEKGFSFGGPNMFAYNDPEKPSLGKFIVDKQMSMYAMEDSNNPQNEFRNKREKLFVDYKQYLKDEFDQRKKQWDAFKKKKKQQANIGISLKNVMRTSKVEWTNQSTDESIRSKILGFL